MCLKLSTWVCVHWSMSMVKKMLHLLLSPFGRVSVPMSLFHFIQQIVVQKYGSFAQQYEPLSLLFMQSSNLLQHLPFKIAFYFHLLSNPPLCSWLPWCLIALFHNSCFLWCKWASHTGKASCWAPALAIHRSLGETRGPWAAFPALYLEVRDFPILSASQLEMLLYPHVERHQREPTQTGLFCWKFGTGSLRPEDNLTSWCVNKMHL